MDLVEWQRYDNENGLVECWWTHDFNDYLKTLDLTDKTWLELGGGLGTSWLRHKCKWVDTVESNLDWAKTIQITVDANKLHNGRLISEMVMEGFESEMKRYLDLLPKDKEYDVISVDGLYRTECLEWAVNHLKKRGGMLIADNYNQDYVWISPKADEIMLPYKDREVVYYQKNHTNHEGRQWNTRYWIIPKEQ